MTLMTTFMLTLSQLTPTVVSLHNQSIVSQAFLKIESSMMMLTTTLWAILVAMMAASKNLVSVSAATPQVHQCPTSSSSRQQQQPQIFGVSKRLPAMLSVRGGAVLEPETLDDVQAIILKASSEQKLVVIDFTGWSLSRRRTTAS
jgi:hypothetical protein